MTAVTKCYRTWPYNPNSITAICCVFVVQKVVQQRTTFCVTLLSSIKTQTQRA